jgi:hypothetical protein
MFHYLQIFRTVLLSSLAFVFMFSFSLFVLSSPLGQHLSASPLLDVTTGLVGYWKFDEGVGTTAADSSGNNNTGTLVNSPTWTTGKIGNALSFNGVNSYVNVGSPTVLNDLQSFTYSLWINPRSLGQSIYGGVLIEKAGGSGFKRFTLANNIGQNFRGEVETTGSTVIVNSTLNTVSLNQWQHVVMTYDDTTKTATIYKNGTLLSSGTGGGSLISEAVGNLIIGNNAATSRTFDGSIDDVRIYNRALTASDIQALYALGSGAPSPA